MFGILGVHHPILMSEVSLYRKYRPSTFAEVVGQDQVIRNLKQQVESHHIAHAYLFSGARGTGKTTVARIFAEAIGCKPSDINEIDAASNRGIDDIRELREHVRTLPFESPFKLYIIDEAHMLTTPAWNALLKTIEEPPPHVVFIFATTEKDDVPATILSRCQSYTFLQPSQSELKKYVSQIANKEGVTLDGPSAEVIALFGDGSYRDALSVLEKVMPVARLAKNGAPSFDDVATIVGAPRSVLVNEVVSAFALHDTERGILALQKASQEGIDMNVYLRLIIDKVRAILLLRYASSMKTVLANEYPPDDFSLLVQYADDPAKRINSTVLVELLHAIQYSGFSPVAELPLELALIQCAGEPTQSTPAPSVQHAGAIAQTPAIEPRKIEQKKNFNPATSSKSLPQSPFAK